MSISACIQNPENEKERLFYVPIASESVFRNKWEPIAEELDLRWLRLFSTGVDLEESDISDILDELDLFRSHYMLKFGHDPVVERVDLLVESLETASSRKGVKIFIG